MKLFKWMCVPMMLVNTAAQAALLDEARVVSATATAASMLPAAESVTITTAGTYTLRLTDIGKQGASADAFTSLSVVISQGAQLVRHLALPSALSTTTSNVTLAAGQYRVQVLGMTTGASQYGVDLSNAGAVSVWSDSGAINAPPTSNFSNLQQVLSLTTGDSYTVTITDRNFPVALTALQSVIAQGGNPPVCSRLNIQGSSASCSFVASAAGNQLFVLATPVTNGAGLYSVKVTRNSDGAIAYAATLPLGNLPQPVPVTLPASDSYSLSSFDLQTPVNLNAFRLALVQGAELLTSQSGVGVTLAFNASAGAASLYVIATPATGSSGLYSVNINRAGTAVYSKIEPVSDTNSGSGAEGFVFKANLPVGSYTLQLRDFVLPQSFASLGIAVTQGGASLGSRSSAGSLNFTVVSAGEVSIAVLATPATSSTPGYVPSGLFGFSVTGSAGTTPVLEKTQGVGGSFTSNVINVSTATRYAVSATDFAAPLALDQLQVAVTRGAQLAGSIFGGGTFAFDAAVGEYTVNFIAKAKSSVAYGMYGATVVAAPTVTLSASPTSLAAGGATTLTWSSTDASTCTASGGWSGAQPASGAFTSGALSADATFTLTCTNAAGSTAGSATVTVQAAPAPAKKKGGGAWSVGWLFVLGALGVLRLRPR